MKQPGWKSCKKILCIRTDNIGDVVMTTPALRAIKETLPSVFLALLTSRSAAALGDLIPEITTVYASNVPWEKKKTVAKHTMLLKLLNILHKQQFDGAIIFTNYSQSAFPAALLCYLAHIPLRLGFLRENPHALLTHVVSDTEAFTRIRHGVQRQLALVGSVGFYTKNTSLSLSIPAKAKRHMRQFFTQLKITHQKPILLLHPGATSKKRQYPLLLYKKALEILTKKLCYQVILTGVTSEQTLISKLMQGLTENVFSFAGNVNLSELAALISYADVLIGNNSGPVHIAEAVGTPVVVLYARTNPEHTPWRIANITLYFDVLKEKRSTTPLLAYTIPAKKHPFPTPSHIIEAVTCILDKKSPRTIPKEVQTWT